MKPAKNHFFMFKHWWNQIEPVINAGWIHFVFDQGAEGDELQSLQGCPTGLRWRRCEVQLTINYGEALGHFGILQKNYRKKFWSQTSNNMDRWKKAEVGRVREEKVRRKKIKEERESEERRCRCAKGRKVAQHNVFQCCVASEGLKVGSLKRRVRSHQGRWEMKNCTLLRREAHGNQNGQKCYMFEPLLEVEMMKKCTVCGAKYMSKSKCTKHLSSGHFWKLRCCKSQSTFRSQNVQGTSAPERFWKFGCGEKSKHISKSKCTRHLSSGALLEVEVMKKRMPL